MGEIRKASLYSQFENITGNQSATDGMFSKVGNIVSPTYEISPKYTLTTYTITRSLTGTAYVVAETDRINQKFVLTGFSIAFVKDAACDIATGVLTLNVYINSSSHVLASIPVTTLTAESGFSHHDLAIPLIITCYSSSAYMATVGATFAAGTLSRVITIRGYWL